MKTLQQIKKNKMNDSEFVKEYESIQPEMELIRALVETRKSKNLTQTELSELTGIDQADISKIEKGLRNPSIALLQRLADGMGMTLRIQFVPKNIEIK